MSISLDSFKLNVGALGAVVVVFGSMMMNSIDQVWSPGVLKAKPVSYVVLAVGWCILSYAIAKDRKLSAQAVVWIAVAAVITATLGQNIAKTKPQVRNLLIWAGLCAGVAALSWILAMNLEGITAKVWVAFAGLLLILGTMVVLPAQRRACIVDGPGLPLLAGALTIMVGANAFVGASGTSK